MITRKYTLTENLVSAVLAVVISIPISIAAYKSQSVGYTANMVSVESLSNDFEIATIIPEIPETPEPTSEPINERVSLGEFRITAYCHCSKCCGKWADGVTFTETVATEGRTIAVDPDVIQLGSTVEINGVEYVAEDIGSAIRGNRIDLYMSSHEEALDWGVQYYDVYTVEK